MDAIEDNDVCPVCRSDKYLNPHLKILISPCYHKMCDACVDRIFSLGPSPCPVCGQTLRKAGFSEQRFEDLGVEKEVRIRQRIAKIFNKTRTDFETAREFDDYLEEVENIIWTLIQGIDLEKTEARIQMYQKQNQDLVKRNEKQAQAQAEIDKRRQDAERIKRIEERQRALREEEQAREDEERQRADVLKALEEGKEDPTSVVARGKAALAARTQARALQDRVASDRAEWFLADDGIETSEESFQVPNWTREQIVGKYGLAFRDFTKDTWPPVSDDDVELKSQDVSPWFADSKNEHLARVSGLSVDRVVQRCRSEAWSGLLKRPRP